MGLVLKHLLESKCDVERKDMQGDTPLLLAAKYGKLDNMKLLLKHEANTEKRQKSYGYTPLIYASYNGTVAMVRTLLENRADAGAKDKEGWSSLVHACSSG